NIYEMCEGRLPILFHTGDERYDFSAPRRLAKVAKDFPNLKCIAAHFGGYSRWKEIDCYLGLDNIFFDTSSALFKLTPDEATEMINKFGEDKFMFGVDFPMWDHKEEMERFDKLNLTDTQRSKILYQNAIKFYQIKNI
ncbi:MAG: amidohydrolase family protein, partial [Clostridia bacterium]|nr:amidohydrolase family protein [Clostridia bacterium]